MRHSGMLYRPLLTLGAAIVLVCVLASCSQGGPARVERVVQKDPGSATQVGANMGEQENKTGMVINDPGQAQPGGSYQIKPSNPDDPKFKASKELAGGN